MNNFCVIFTRLSDCRFDMMPSSFLSGAGKESNLKTNNNFLTESKKIC